MTARAQDATAPPVRELKIEREKPDDGTPRTLRFLRENQAFLRGQLDQLRTKIHWRDVDGRGLTEQQRWLQGLGDHLAAADDSLARERQELARRELLERIGDLVEIEGQIDRIETLLAEQDHRLDEIEADYVGRQETALALLATGLPREDAVALLVDAIDGDTVRVALTPDTREALRTGAIAQLLHDFVEPRAASIELRVERADGSVEPLGHVAIDPARDRLTFVEVDLRGDADAAGRLPSVVWTR